jgi:hypothetical protein
MIDYIDILDYIDIFDYATEELRSVSCYTHIVIILFAEDVANAKEGSC